MGIKENKRKGQLPMSRKTRALAKARAERLPYEWFVLKLQRPIFTTEKPVYLAYNESRDFSFQTNSNAIRDAIGDGLKVYVHATLDTRGNLELGYRIPFEEWPNW